VYLVWATFAAWVGIGTGLAVATSTSLQLPGAGVFLGAGLFLDWSGLALRLWANRTDDNVETDTRDLVALGATPARRERHLPHALLEQISSCFGDGCGVEGVGDDGQ